MKKNKKPGIYYKGKPVDKLSESERIVLMFKLYGSPKQRKKIRRRIKIKI